MTTKQSALILIVAEGRYKGCLLNRGLQGFTAWDSCDRDLGDFETATVARDAIIKAFAA